jgi:capsular exopolysaccharide synthesis family protein
MTAYPGEPVAVVEEPRELDNELTLKSVWTAVRRRWWAVGAVLIIITALGTWRTIHRVDMYRSSARVQVAQQQSPIQGMQMQQPYDFRINRLAAEEQVIRSGPVAAGAARNVGLQLIVADPRELRRSAITTIPPRIDSTAIPGEYRLRLGESDYALSSGGSELATARYGETLVARGITLAIPVRPGVQEREVVLRVVPLADATAIVQNSIQTSVIPQTDIVQISVVMPDQLLAMQTANEVATEYQKFAKDVMVSRARDRAAFIRARLADQATEVAAAQSALKNFLQSNQLTDVASEAAALTDQIYELQGIRQSVQLDFDNYQSLMEDLTLADTSTERLRRLVGTGALANNSSVQNLYTRWQELVQERQTKLSIRTASSPEIAVIDSQIRTTKANLREASDLYLTTLRQKLKSYDDRLAALRRETQRYPALSADQQRLIANHRSVQSVYESLQNMYQVAQIEEAVETDVVRIIDSAGYPIRPESPNRRADVLLAIALGILVGVGVAVLLDRLDDSVRSPDEISEQLNLTMLGMIPGIKLEHDPEPGAVMMERLVTHANPRSPVAESYRSLRTNLAFARARQNIKTLVLTSPGPADGKSTTVANLAITFAQQGQRTLLIDGDLRRAVLDKTFSVPRSPGLTEVIVGEAELEQAVNGTDVPNLFVLGSGQFPPNPSELLGSTAMANVIRDAREQFDVVLFDSPPLLAVTDAAVLSTMVDGTILVVRMGATARQAVRRALGQLHAVHARVLGAVMNDVDLRRSSYYGGYGYAYYAYYGSEANGNGHDRGVMDRLRRITSWTSSGGSKGK